MKIIRFFINHSSGPDLVFCLKAFAQFVEINREIPQQRYMNFIEKLGLVRKKKTHLAFTTQNLPLVRYNRFKKSLAEKNIPDFLSVIIQGQIWAFA